MLNPFQGLPASQATSYLTTALQQGGITHAYLLTGSGNGPRQIALHFAAALLAQGDEAEFDAALRGAHPDLFELAPGSSTGYLVDQVRQIVHDANLAPVRSARKVFVINDAHKMTSSSANALLKTLEEPPGPVHVLLFAPGEQAVLQTLRSRCQVVRCLSEGVGAVCQNTQLDRLLATLAQGMGDRRLLDEAKALVTAALDGVELLKAQQAEEQERVSEMLSAKARKELAESHKRQAALKQRACLIGLLDQMRSWLRDCLMMVNGASARLSQPSRLHALTQVAQSVTVSGVLAALKAVDAAQNDISHNVTPQLAVEACLFEIREALCPRL